LYSKKVIEHLSKNFRRNYTFNSTLYIGNKELLSERVRKKSYSTTRITMRFRQETFDDLADLAYALDTTVSTAAAILLHASVRNTEIVNDYVARFVEETLDDSRKEQLRAVLTYIRKENPYGTNDITLAQLISYIMDEFKGQTRHIKRTIESWLDNVTEKD
jgi:NDP-sugar pyrophosphorylase family protein